MKCYRYLLLILLLFHLSASAQVSVRHIPFRKGELWGYADTGKRIIIQPRFTQAFPFQDNYRAIVKLREHYHLMDTFGSISADSFESFSIFSEGLLPVMQSKKVGYMNTEGKLVIPCRYDAAEPFSEGRAVVFMSPHTGVIDRDGAYVVPLKLEATSKKYSSGRLLVTEKGKTFFIDRNGNPFPLRKDLSPVDGFSEGLAPVYRAIAGKQGDTVYRLAYINPAGNIVIDSLFEHNSYSQAQPFTNGRAVIMVPYDMHKEFFFLDTAGKLSPPYNSVKPFSEGLALAITGYFMSDNYIVDTGYHIHGKILGNLKQAGDFHEGLACIGRDSTGKDDVHYGYVNTWGRTVIRFKYDYATDFDHGLAAVILNGRWGYIDRQGKEYWED